MYAWGHIMYEEVSHEGLTVRGVIPVLYVWDGF
jgi:hypothetical protein